MFGNNEFPRLGKRFLQVLLAFCRFLQGAMSLLGFSFADLVRKISRRSCVSLPLSIFWKGFRLFKVARLKHGGRGVEVGSRGENPAP